jgi:hypothetical protein
MSNEWGRGAVGAMSIYRGNGSTRRDAAPVPLCISPDLAAAMGSQRLRWATIVILRADTKQRLVKTLRAG